MPPSAVSSSSRKRGIVVGRPSVGEPPKKIAKRIETIEFTIHNFKEQKEERGKFISSRGTKAHGYEWQIEVFPRGDLFSAESRDYIACYLRLIDKAATAKWTMRCKNYSQTDRHYFTSENKCACRGWPDFLPQERVLENFLEDDGSLVIEVDIQIAEDDRRVWYPEKLETNAILVHLYADASSKTSDVVFAVGDGNYRAHKNILDLRCKKLYEIAEDSDDGTPIPIASTKADIFENLLEYIYTVRTPKIEKEDVAVDLLEAADRFDCVQLKLYVESVLVDRFLDADNAASLLLIADSHSCALLKEAATDLFLKDASSVKKSKDWPKVQDSKRLLNELLEASLSFNSTSNHSDTTNDNNKNNNGVDRMDVTSLREELQQAGREVDGSREVLVNRWKALHSEKE